MWSIAGDRSKLLAAFVSAAVLSAANKLRRLAFCAFIVHGCLGQLNPLPTSATMGMTIE